jgi:uncharacterized protein with GYD domain
MIAYVSLINWTEQGIKNVKETVKRAETAMSIAERMGGRITSIMWTQGAYDLVVSSEFPNEETAQVFLLALAREGNIRTQTLRAFSAGEIKAVIEKLP